MMEAIDCATGVSCQEKTVLCHRQFVNEQWVVLLMYCSTANGSKWQSAICGVAPPSQG